MGQLILVLLGIAFLRGARAEAADSRVGLQAEGTRFSAAGRLLDEAILRKACPGAALVIGGHAALHHVGVEGHITFDEVSAPVEPDTLYDIASLTKVVATTALAMTLVDEAKLDLDAPVARLLAELPTLRNEIRVRDLLCHSSGLPAWAPVYGAARGRDPVLSRVAETKLEYEPRTKCVYSDLGMILLGAILEKAGGKPLDALARERIFEPLGMHDTLYRPGPELLPRIAPTEECAWRRRLLHGEVDDENAYAMGGVAGHAGLFSTAADLSRFAQMMLGRGTLDGRRLVKAETVDLFTKRCDVPGSTRTLGWETAAGDPWAGSLWSGRAYGHTGATGTMIWIDPEYDTFLVLLTNSVFPRRGGDAFNQLRKQVAETVMSIVRSKPRATP